ncbi:MAG: prepilin-type N-terminal cleavage/methylation domain-containing protein [Armatimonadetes bacterium]|nr:prepilin-type N-terminal cleavage/methylation domain-containing protein [Armatimonadota bacterium]
MTLGLPGSLKYVHKRGLTLVEVLVAIVLVGVGLASLVAGLGSLTRSYSSAQEREIMHRLAHEKYEDLLATGDWITVSDGDFEDVRYAKYEWEVETSTTEVEDLESLRVIVRVIDAGDNAAVVAEGLVYRPLVASEGGAQ